MHRIRAAVTAPFRPEQDDRLPCDVAQFDIRSATCQIEVEYGVVGLTHGVQNVRGHAAGGRPQVGFRLPAILRLRGKPASHESRQIAHAQIAAEEIRLPFAVRVAGDRGHAVKLPLIRFFAGIRGKHLHMRYDKLGDDHYDIVSAYQKSMRGSDPDAALHYLARLLEAGDLPSACRRLMVCACEDVGLAWPQIIPIVKAAVDIANAVGLPEARLPLADAVVLVATAPKSNSAHNAINAAVADVQAGRTGPIPRQLQNKHYDGADAKVKGQHYLYPHDFPNHWTAQQYLPDAIKDRRYYEPGDNKNEQAFAQYWKMIKGE